MAETAQQLESQGGAGAAHGETIHLPAPTAWPILLAFGCTIAAAGLVTNLWVTAFGAVLMLTRRNRRRGCRHPGASARPPYWLQADRPNNLPAGVAMGCG